MNLDNLPPMLILKILKNGKNIRLKHIKKFFKNKLSADQTQIKKDQNVIEDNKKQTEEKIKKLKKIKAQSTTFQETNCSACNNRLYNPAMHFMCGHSFHRDCLESLECPLCIVEQKEIIERNERCMQGFSEKTFDEDLSKAKNKFDIIAEYLGKLNF